MAKRFLTELGAIAMVFTLGFLICVATARADYCGSNSNCPKPPSIKPPCIADCLPGYVHPPGQPCICVKNWGNKPPVK